MAGFWRSVFSESDGSGSFSRIASGLHSVAGLGWITHVVAHTHAIPDPTVLVGVAAFVTAPYAANKVSNAVSSFSDHPMAPPAANPAVPPIALGDPHPAGTGAPLVPPA